MRYNGRYPVDEMWDVRQSLIDDFNRNASNNKYIASVDRKCLDYLHDCRQKRTERYHRKRMTSDEKEDGGENVHNQSDLRETNFSELAENQHRTESCKYFVDYFGDKNYKGFENDNFQLIQPTDSEFLIKEEPETENIETNINDDGSGSNVVFKRSKNCDNTEKDNILNEIGSAKMDDIIPQNIRSENSNDVVDGSVHKFPDVTDIFCDENNDILHKKKCENIEREKSKKCDKIKNYKDFVKTVSKLVNFDKKDNKTESSMKRKKEKSKDKKSSKSSNKKGEGGNIMRNTRSSSRSAKVHAEEKLSAKTKKEKNTKLNSSKQNSSKKKTMNKYTNRLRSTKEIQNENEGQITSTSKQKIKEKVKSKRRKSVSSLDDDIPLFKYSKQGSDNRGTKENEFNEESVEGNTLDETVVYSNCEENYFSDQNQFTSSPVVDFNKCTNFQSVKNDENITEPWHLNSEKNENDMVSCKNNVTDGDGFNQNYQFSDNLSDVENISDTSLEIIDEPDADNASDLKLQTSNDLDSINNNKDLKCDTDDKNYKENKDLKCDADKNYQENKNKDLKYDTDKNYQEILWEYLKCDFCDFLVSKKKPQNYQLMEEHLESTKHNAASVVKVSITDGELKPIYVKREHAILYSLEKASVLPYCPTCYSVMPSIWTVQLHTKFKHGGQMHKDIYCLGKVENVVNIPIPKKINMCKQCGQKQIHIQKHWKCHNHYPYVQPTDDQIAQYSCNVCHRHFVTFFSALSHAVVHSQDGQRVQNVGVKVTYLSKSSQTFTMLPREKTLTSGRAIEMLNQARAANKTGQWTRIQRKEFEIMATEWKRCFKQH